MAVADRACRALAAASGWSVLSVEYRLAPENPYPAPPEDCVAAVRWVRDHGAKLGVDATRTVVLRGTGYAPAGRVLLYPNPTPAPVLGRRSPSIGAYGRPLA